MHKCCKLYLFEFLDEPSGFNATLHIEADVHFDLSEGVSQFDDGNLGTHMTQMPILNGDCQAGNNQTITTILTLFCKTVCTPVSITVLQVYCKPENTTHTQSYTNTRLLI